MPRRDGTGPKAQGERNGKGRRYGRGCCQMPPGLSGREEMERCIQRLERQLEAVSRQLDGWPDEAQTGQERKQ